MFTIQKDFRFEAAHRLPHHDGKCSRLHGHSWKGTLVLTSHAQSGYQLIKKGPKVGMLKDFGDISDILKPFVDSYLDHQYLNETTHLENPTSEELARWIYDMLEPRFNGMLIAVIIEETCTSRAEYRP